MQASQPQDCLLSKHSSYNYEWEDGIGGKGDSLCDSGDIPASNSVCSTGGLLDWLQNVLQEQAGQNRRTTGEAECRELGAVQQGHLQRISPLVGADPEFPRTQSRMLSQGVPVTCQGPRDAWDGRVGEEEPQHSYDLQDPDYQDDLIRTRQHLIRFYDVEKGADVDVNNAVRSESALRDNREYSEDPRTWTRGRETGDIVVHDEQSGKGFIVPYDLAKVRNRFRSSPLKADLACEAQQATPHVGDDKDDSPDLGQSMNSRANISWKDDLDWVQIVQQDISRGELKAIAIHNLSFSPPKTGTSWSHGTFSRGPQDSERCPTSAEEHLVGSRSDKERDRQYMLERKLAELKAGVQGLSHSPPPPPPCIW